MNTILKYTYRMSKKFKDIILLLRSQGLSYNKIQEITGASKGTICYHLGANQKQKSLNRSREARKKLSALDIKVRRFRSYRNTLLVNSTPSFAFNKRRLSPKYKYKLLNLKLKRFFTSYAEEKQGNRKLKKEYPFTATDVLKVKPAICYLTGRSIDFNSPNTYELDHIIPRAKGGDNSLENLGVACPQANRGKSDLSVEEFFQMCVDVVKFNNLL